MVDITPDRKIFPAPGSQFRARTHSDAVEALDLVLQAGKTLEAAMNEGLQAARLTAAQGRALRAIAAEPGLTVGNLRARLGISKQSLAPVLKALTQHGLVTAAGPGVDRRRRHLRLTAKGRDVWADAERRAVALLSAASAAAGPVHSRGFQAVLHRLADLADESP